MSPKFVQSPGGTEKKHDCPDCLYCQMCSDARCQACRCGSQRPAKMDFADQIARFEAINRDDPVRPDRPLRITEDRG